MDYAGPLWLGSIFDPNFIELMMKENRSVAFRNSARITKLLSLAKEEASAPITYFVVDKLSGKLGLPSPSIQAFINALRNSGFQAVQTHFNTRGIRTDAPAMEMHKLLKEASGS
jgi:tRNA (guanine26-N2/guanine27-N2)-dimethyltransferase